MKLKYIVKIFVITYLIFGITNSFAENKVVYVDMNKILNQSKVGVFVENDDNSVIDNIFTYNSIAIQISSNSEDNRIEDNEIKKSFTSGIYLFETEESIIKNNYIITKILF